MAILDRENYFIRVNEMVADDGSDKAISFIEDMSDTYNALAERTEDASEWERKYRENDEAWRKKYQARFFRGDAEIIDTKEEEIELRPEEVTIEDLFE